MGGVMDNTKTVQFPPSSYMTFMDKLHGYIELHEQAIKREQAKKTNVVFEIGSKSRRLKRDGSVVLMPREFGYLFSALSEFIDNPHRLPELYAWGGEMMNNRESRRISAQIQMVLLSNCELEGGRIGRATSAGMKTISYKKIQEDYALRFGEILHESTLLRHMKALYHAGYFHSERINVVVEKNNGTIRSAASFKQLTSIYFNDLKVSRYPNIIELIKASTQRQKDKGLLLTWIPIRRIAKGIQEVFNAAKMDQFAQTTANIFHAHSATPNLSPP